MHFEVITPAEFTKFAAKSPYKSFMQTVEIAHLREKNGWTAYYFAVKQGNKTLAATLALAKPTFLGKSLFITPGGPLLDFENRELTEFFLKNLKSFARSHNGYALRIDPYYELIERDKNGLEVTGGFNRTSALKTLKSLNFHPTAHDGQPKYLFCLDLDGRSPEVIFKDFKQNTRNLIRRAERKGVTVRELNREELPILKKITEATSERRHFSDRPLSYYEQMYDLFATKGQVKFLLAEASEEPLSTAMFMLYGDEIIYLFSGSDEPYMKEYNAQYLIQWHMIKYAASHGFKRYNFYGIQGLPDPEKPGYGIYLFKKGFGGHVVELLGAFEAPLSPLYFAHALLAKLKPKKS